LRHAAKGPPFHSGPLATYRNGPVSSNVRHHELHRPRRIGLLCQRRFKAIRGAAHQPCPAARNLQGKCRVPAYPTSTSGTPAHNFRARSLTPRAGKFALRWSVRRFSRTSAQAHLQCKSCWWLALRAGVLRRAVSLSGVAQRRAAGAHEVGRLNKRHQGRALQRSTRLARTTAPVFNHSTISASVRAQHAA
jgi:hypothetical protein